MRSGNDRAAAAQIAACLGGKFKEATQIESGDIMLFQALKYIQTNSLSIMSPLVQWAVEYTATAYNIVNERANSIDYSTIIADFM
ncbi:MAG: hypothetical protein JXR49_11495 [Acidobacteria bacterium]|nr:hypothetical protein [Acidobacteriota bacterium]